MTPGPRRSASAAGATVNAGSVRVGACPDSRARPVLGAFRPDLLRRARHRGYPRDHLMGQDEQPRNLKAMLSEAKDTSELMVDLAYAALFFGDARHGRRGRTSSRSASTTSSTRCARCACSPRARRATPRRCRACCTWSRRSSAWATPPSTSPASSPTGSASPPRSSPTSRPPRRSRTACASGPTRALAHRSLADVELPDRGRHARRRHPARQGVDHRPRRRRDAAARRRAHPARPAGRHRRAARARRRARVAPAGHRRRSRDPPTSTAPSTCSSR